MPHVAASLGWMRGAAKKFGRPVAWITAPLPRGRHPGRSETEKIDACLSHRCRDGSWSGRGVGRFGAVRGLRFRRGRAAARGHVVKGHVARTARAPMVRRQWGGEPRRVSWGILTEGSGFLPATKRPRSLLGWHPGRQFCMGALRTARVAVSFVVCTVAAVVLVAVADGMLGFFPFPPGHELDVPSPARLAAPAPVLTAVVTAPKQSTDLASPESRAIITGGTAKEAVGTDREAVAGRGAGQDTAGSTNQQASGADGARDEVRPWLSLGSSGRDVIDLQTRLNASGSVTACASPAMGCAPPTPLSVDGQFGPKTLARVQEFQRNNAIPPDGIVGPQTWKKLVTPQRA
jgi:hypothetical protein